MFKKMEPTKGNIFDLVAGIGNFHCYLLNDIQESGLYGEEQFLQ